MANIIETVLLLALPASGKSEVRNYLKHLPHDECEKDFHMGPTVQLDDFPYVHVMRRIDDELAKMGEDRIFFAAPDKPFKNPVDWGTLVALVNEDYGDLVAKKQFKPASAAALMLERIEKAALSVGAPQRLSLLKAGTKEKLEQVLEKEAAGMLAEKLANYTDTLKGKTLVIEFARGGPDGSPMPLKPPFGYAHSVGLLAPRILEKARILYVWVTPEESRRKNNERSNPNDPGSILHHGVPLDVMLNDYGCDDMDWLERNSGRPGTIAVVCRGKKLNIPLARFDNRVDKTSFLRADKKDWPADKVKAVHEGLKGALEKLAAYKG